MKKHIMLVAVLACVLGLTTGCGAAETVTQNDYFTAADATETAKQITSMIQEIYATDQVSAYGDYPVVIQAVDSWANAADDMGDFIGITTAEASFDGDTCTVEVGIDGSKRDAVETIVFTEGSLLSMSTDVKYSLGETMARAGMNTLIGMGTTFIILITISLIISLFVFIPKIQALFTKKEESPAIASIDNAVQQIVRQEEAADDTELIAVIAAAIAASEGAASADGYVVRSIRKIGRRTR
ncbi:MAG: OadG family protein [Lachnospiraceae bacterium]|nr:OadG family protein [Lachnospiraceae bacterium]